QVVGVVLVAADVAELGPVAVAVDLSARGVVGQGDRVVPAPLVVEQAVAVAVAVDGGGPREQGVGPAVPAVVGQRPHLRVGHALLVGRPVQVAGGVVTEVAAGGLDAAGGAGPLRVAHEQRASDLHADRLGHVLVDVDRGAAGVR